MYVIAPAIRGTREYARRSQILCEPTGGDLFTSLWQRDNMHAMPLELYPFRFLDDVTKKWVRARYVAELHVIAERYTKWEITGPPEIRSGAPVVMFSPSAALKPLSRSTRGHLPPVEDPPPDHGPTPDPPPVEQPPPIEDQLERFLVLVFLRRYVAYCARRRRFAAMDGAARLFAEVRRVTCRL
jgi:hypothetical protein